MCRSHRSLLTQLADERPRHRRTKRRSGSLSDDELQAAYDFVLELLIGAHENSEWSDGELVIDANLGNIHLLQAAFYAVKLELQRLRIPAKKITHSELKKISWSPSDAGKSIVER